MTDKLQSFLELIYRTTITEIIKVILGFVFTVTLFILSSHILTTVWEFLDPFKWYLSVLFGTGGALIFIFIYQRMSKFHPIFPRLDFDFQILDNDIYYEYRDLTHLIYRRRKVLKALKNGLDAYNDKYLWTGRGNVAISSAIREQTVRETFKKNVWQFYEIRFQKVLSKGESIETEVVWDLEDAARVAVPFMSATVEEPTDLLKLSLSLPPDLKVGQVTCEISSGIGSKKPLSSKTMNLDRYGRVSWGIEKPKLLHHYEIRWLLPSLG